MSTQEQLLIMRQSTLIEKMDLENKALREELVSITRSYSLMLSSRNTWKEKYEYVQKELKRLTKE